jgi:acetylglutamate kinase
MMNAQEKQARQVPLTPPVVLKVGGNELDDPIFVKGLVDYVTMLRAQSHPVAIVHGGGRFIEEIQNKLQIPVEKIDGLRVTTPEVMQAVRMALVGVIGQDLCLALQRHGLPAVALSACSGMGRPAISGMRKGLPDQYPNAASAGPGDLGLVGTVESVDTRIFSLMLQAGITPVIAPPAIEDCSTWLNVNADEAAAAIAAALCARELIFLTNVPGLTLSGTVQGTIHAESIASVLEAPEVTGGMIPKLKAAAWAALNGVAEVGLGSLASLANGTHTRIQRRQAK